MGFLAQNDTQSKNQLSLQTTHRQASEGYGGFGQAMAPPKPTPAPNVGPTSFWNRIGQVGIGKVNVLNAFRAVAGAAHAGVETVARSLPGGQNDIKAQQQQSQSASNTIKNISNLQKQGKISQPQAQKIIQSQASNLNASTQQASKTNQALTFQGQQKTGVNTVKDIGNGLISSERVVAKGVSRVLPGGSNDLTANKNLSAQNSKNLVLYNSLYKQGKISKDKYQQLTGQVANDQGQVASNTDQTIKDMPTKRELAAGFAGTGLDIITGGGGKLLRADSKVAEEGAAKIAAGKLARGAVKEGQEVGSKAVHHGTQAAIGASAGASNAQSTGANAKETLKQATIGAVIPLAAEGAGKIFKSGAAAAIDKIKSHSEVHPTPEEASASFKINGSKTAPKLDESNINKAAAAAHTDIPVVDNSSAAEKLGVRTPVRPGIKDISETSKINVRTPQRMSDQQFTGEFNKLSKGYDQETAQLQKSNLPPRQLKVASDKLEQKYQVKLNDLQDRYTKPQLSPQQAPKTIAKSTIPAGKTTGGLSTTKRTKASASVPDGAVVHTSEGKMVVAKDMTPRDTVGISTGQPSGMKTAGSAVKLEKEAVERGLATHIDGLPEYASINKAEQSARATELINNDKARAIRIIQGKEAPPPGLHPQAIHNGLVALVRKTGDGDLMKAVAQSTENTELSKHGQGLSLAAERDPHDPVEMTRQINRERATAFERRNGIKANTAVKSETQKDLKAVNSSIKVPSKSEWQMFIESIKC